MVLFTSSSVYPLAAQNGTPNTVPQRHATMISRKQVIPVSSFYIAFLCCLVLNCFSSWLLVTSSSQSLSLPVTFLEQRQQHRPQQKQTIAAYYATVRNKNEELPKWIASYSQWHSETRQSGFNETNWRDYKYLVSRCHQQDMPCGGLADRLRALPFLVQVAAMTGRILLISWQRPYDLTEFLQPAGGIDWRLPSFVEVNNVSSPVFTRIDQLPRIQESVDTVVSVRFAAYKQAEKHFDRYKVQSNDANMTAVLAPLWKLFFRPAAPVQERLNDIYQYYNLTTTLPYVATHLRVLYDRALSNDGMVEVVRNALACTSRFSAFDEDTPIVVTSDSLVALKVAGQLSPRQVIVTSRRDMRNDTAAEPILHLDRGSQFFEPQTAPAMSDQSQNEENFPVQAYYATFVDFYLLMGAQCVAYDRGGYGRLASLLSDNPACHVHHRHDQCL